VGCTWFTVCNCSGILVFEKGVGDYKVVGFTEFREVSTIVFLACIRASYPIVCNRGSSFAKDICTDVLCLREQTSVYTGVQVPYYECRRVRRTAVVSVLKLVIEGLFFLLRSHVRWSIHTNDIAWPVACGKSKEDDPVRDRGNINQELTKVWCNNDPYTRRGPCWACVRTRPRFALGFARAFRFGCAFGAAWSWGCGTVLGGVVLGGLGEERENKNPSIS